MKQLKDFPFEIIGVNSDQDLEALQKVIKKENITWRSFQNEKGVDGTISDNWAIAGWPTIFILDEKGTIRWKGHSGDIDGEITKLLAEMGHDVKLVHEDESSHEKDEEDQKDEDSDPKASKSDDKSQADASQSSSTDGSDKGGASN